jgi:hypothetical protein
MRNFLIAISLLSTLGGCTKAQTVSAINTGVNVAVDLCQVAPNLLPPGTPAGTVVALVCPAVEAGAPPVTVFIDQLVWNAMVQKRAAERAAQSR